MFSRESEKVEIVPKSKCGFAYILDKLQQYFLQMCYGFFSGISIQPLLLYISFSNTVILRKPTFLL